MTTFNLTCEAVETTLHEYLDETLEPWVRASIEEHLRDCARCTAFARGLRTITGEVAALPALLPERDPWARIAGRIGASVVDSGPLADVAPITPTPEAIVSASDSPLPISERPAVGIEAPVATAEPAMVTRELPMRMGKLPMRIVEPPVLSSDELPVLTSDGPPVLAIPVCVLPSPKEESVSQPGLLTGELSPPASEPLAPASEPVPPSRTPGVPETAPVYARLGPRREKSWRREWMGLAAAALVLVTAGTTFLLTKQWLGPARPTNVASDKGTRSERLSVERGIRGPAAGREQVPGAVASDSLTPTPPTGQPGSALTVSATSVPPVTRSPEDVVYEKEIPALQRIVRRQKAELDPSTVAEIEKNLRTLDSAIAQIRAALKKDPGSSLLDGQASRALEMKVELLRRAAMLRSNT
jgi:Putative zinc-finger